MDSVFFQSMLVRPPKLLGRQLRHFSCWHALLLLQFDSPFLRGGKPTTADLVQAIWICSQEYHPDRPFLPDTDLQEIHDWGKNSGTEWDPVKILEGLTVYLDNYIALPKLWYRKGAKTSNVPWPFKLVATVLTLFPGFSEAQAWNMPVARASCYHAAIRENDGASLEANTERAIIDRLKEQGLNESPEVIHGAPQT